MPHIAGHDRFQLLLVPEPLDYVDPENPARFIEAFVDGLGMSLPQQQLAFVPVQLCNERTHPCSLDDF
jgi:hypothetical protein